MDNDCNGRADLDDGFEYYGESIELLTDIWNPLIAWSPVSGLYGLAWEEFPGDDRHVRFNLLNPDGTLTETSDLVSQNNITSVDENRLKAMAWGDGEFSVVYRQNSESGGAGLYFQRIGAYGGLLGGRVLLTENDSNTVTLAQAVGRDWFIFWIEDDRSWGARISDSGELQENEEVGHDSGQHVSTMAASSDDQVAFAYWDSEEDQIYWRRFTESLSGTNEEEVLSSPESSLGGPVLGGSVHGFGFVWTEAIDSLGRLRFREFATDGTPMCDPVDLPNPTDGVNLNGVVAHAEGWLVSFQVPIMCTTQSYPSVARVGSTCAPQGTYESLTGTQSVFHAYDALIAGGEAGYAIMWIGDSWIDYSSTLFIHVLGPHLCDAPVL